MSQQQQLKVEHRLYESATSIKPVVSMLISLPPLITIFASDELLKHPHIAIQVAIASCLSSEVSWITALNAPYSDKTMHNIFPLIISSFTLLSDNSTEMYAKGARIHKTIANVRYCIIILDLDHEQVIIDML